MSSTLKRWRAIFVALALAIGLAIAPNPTPASAMPAADFIKLVTPMAQASERQFGVPTSVSIAQAILESGWGESKLTKEANSFFGIKCRSTTSPYQNGCYSVTTTEYTAEGVKYTITAKFRKYDSPADSFTDHGHFLKVNSRYANAFNYTNNPDRFAYEIHKAGYATDPAYTSSLISLMRRYDLYQYDITPRSSKVVSPSIFGQAGRTASAGTTVTFISTFYADPSPKVSWQTSTDGTTWKSFSNDSHNTITNYGYRTVLKRTLSTVGKVWIRTKVTNSAGKSAYTTKVLLTTNPVTFPVERIGGPSRYSSAVAISKARLGTNSTPVIYIAAGGAYAHILGAQGAAAKYNGGVLLVEQDAIPAVTATELKRLNPRRIYVVGGSSVSDKVLNQLKSYTSGTVTRVVDRDRTTTSVKVSRTAFPAGSATTVVMASGWNYFDLIAAGSWMGRYDVPVLLTQKDGSLQKETIAELKRLGAKKVLIVGGTSSVPSSLVSKLQALGLTVTRTGSTTAKGTSLATAKKAWPSSADVVYLTSSTKYLDALALPELPDGKPGPILEVSGSCVSAETVNYIKALNPDKLVLIGGPTVVAASIGSLKVC